jgi:hypothetical protein
MLRLVVAGLAVIVLVLAGVTGFLVYDESSDGGNELPPTVTGTAGWQAVPYKDRHDMCHEFATAIAPRPSDYRAVYPACMECGPDKLSVSTALGWYCP